MHFLIQLDVKIVLMTQWQQIILGAHKSQGTFRNKFNLHEAGLDLARLWKYSKLITCCQWENPVFPHWYIFSTLSMLRENVSDCLPKVILRQMCQWTYVACKEIQGAFENFRIKSFFFLWNVSLLLSTRSASTLSKYVVRLSNAEIASLVSVHVWEQLFTLCTFIDTLISISAAHTHTQTKPQPLTE